MLLHIKEYYFSVYRVIQIQLYTSRASNNTKTKVESKYYTYLETSIYHTETHSKF